MSATNFACVGRCVKSPISNLSSSYNGGDSIDPGVANFEELVEQAEFVHQLQRRGMDGIAAKIAEEVLVLFEYGDGESGPGQQAGRASSRPDLHR